MPRKNPPILVESPLTGRVYVATRYRWKDNGILLASEKYDVTDQFEELAARQAESDHPDDGGDDEQTR